MSIRILVICLLSMFFLLASSIKILGWQKKVFSIQLGMFVKYGLNRQIMFLVGLAELFGAIAVWFQGSYIGVIGALAIFTTSLGAIICHLIFDTWKDGIPAMVTFLLTGYLLSTDWEVFMSLVRNIY
ncbi:DoxX family protein [Endozoicomonas atrinae]|uniref:DoxX family protein n=1 Tax=Endozoicomonas atrinae TaxID=1333660 RepID=UPI003B00F4DA